MDLHHNCNKYCDLIVHFMSAVFYCLTESSKNSTCVAQDLLQWHISTFTLAALPLVCILVGIIIGIIIGVCILYYCCLSEEGKREVDKKANKCCQHLRNLVCTCKCC